MFVSLFKLLVNHRRSPVDGEEEEEEESQRSTNDRSCY